MKLSNREKKILEYIVDDRRVTMNELARRSGYVKSTLSLVTNKLCRMGLVTKYPQGQERIINITPSGRKF